MVDFTFYLKYGILEITFMINKDVLNGRTTHEKMVISAQKLLIGRAMTFV